MSAKSFDTGALGEQHPLISRQESSSYQFANASAWGREQRQAV